MELWIVRHGETIANINRIMQGHQGGELTEKGFAQAKCLGNRLSSLKFDEVYVSDLNRTKQTADMILQYHSDIQVVYDKRIRERCGGILEGKPLSKFKEIATSKGMSLRKFRPKEGENWDDVYKRAKDFINELIIKNIKQDYVEEIQLRNFSENEIIKISQDINNNLTKQIENTKINENNNSSQILSLSNEIKISKKNSLVLESEFFHENSSSNTKEENLLNKNKPYIGYNPNKEIQRILVVTHGGFIMELINVIRNKKGLDKSTKNNSFNTAVYVLKIYCSNCGGKCKDCGINMLEYDFIIYNDNSHCADLK